MKLIEKIKERKKEICIATGVIVTGVVLANRVPVWMKYPYKSWIRYSDKLTKHAYDEYFACSSGKTDGGYVGIYHTKDTVMEKISEIVANEPNDRLYKIAIEKIRTES